MATLTLVLPVLDPAAPTARTAEAVHRVLGGDVVVVGAGESARFVGACDAWVVPEGPGRGDHVLAGLAVANTPLVGWMRPGGADPVAVALAIERGQKVASRTWLAKAQGYGRPLQAARAVWDAGARATWRHGRLLWDPDAHPVVATSDLVAHWQDAPRDERFDAWVLGRARQRGTPVVRFPARAYGR